VVRKDERRARIVTAVTEHGEITRVDELMQRICRLAVGEMAVPGTPGTGGGHGGTAVVVAH
jgi:hypothetical protein